MAMADVMLRNCRAGMIMRSVFEGPTGLLAGETGAAGHVKERRPGGTLNCRDPIIATSVFTNNLTNLRSPLLDLDTPQKPSVQHHAQM
jgi:hypothetical protein